MGLLPFTPGAMTALEAGAVLLPGFALPADAALLRDVAAIAGRAPWRHMTVPGGHSMSVAMTNAGPLGWVADRSGYRYSAVDPDSGSLWPDMPPAFARLATEAAAQAGFPGFQSNACLMNRYAPGARLSLHQDKDEGDFSHPIVSVSLGLPATFLWGGARRTDPTRKIRLEHGDVVVFGGEARLRYHGIAPLRAGTHPALGECRVNLTFRRVVGKA
ncbi:MAG TPA: DNA oxidative demethylase AlkB [Terriglobales bacterium]|nr:DNA oxidative demethylase AlkB [Terriglobales bacterium]